jgi:hypothetical protein
MKYFLFAVFTLLLLAGQVDAQKHQPHYKLSQPHREHKSGKTGFVGKDPSRKYKPAKSGFVGMNPSRKYKAGKTGFVGKDPSHKYKPPKISFVGNDPVMDRPNYKFMKPEVAPAPKSNLYIPKSRIREPKGRVRFMAADNVTHESEIKIPKEVTYKQMELPKMRGDKKIKMPKTGFIGVNPNMGTNNVKMKHNSDIQYKTAYKFGKKGGLDKSSQRQ